MTAAKHTPGPLAVIASASGKPLIVADHPHHDGDVARMARDTPEAWATAQLFAAAPELYAALSGLIDVLEDAGFETAVMEDARAAIAKATGSAQ